MSYKLFLIKIKKTPYWEYDTLRSVVIMAKNEQSARKMIIVKELYGDEVEVRTHSKNTFLRQPKLWLSPKFATAKIIGIPTPNMGKRAKVIIVEFLNG